MRVLLAVPFLVLLVLFTLSNTRPVQLALWPLDVTVDIPLAIAVLASMAVGVLIGGLMVWLPALRHRLRARRAEQRARRLQTSLDRAVAQHTARLPPAGPS